MDNQILTSKLRIPSTPPGLVSRPRLLQRLDEGLSRRLILISAAPGSGKTSLLSGWLQSQSLKTAWVALDDDDNDPTLFLEYLLAAVHRIIPQVHINLSRQIETRGLPFLIKTMSALINELEKLSDPFILVLDDYHVINEASIHRLISMLLEHQPPCLHLVIATRVDPPLPVALMRGRGQVTELRAQDLRFTQPEIAMFLRQVFHLELPEQDILALEARTEGWAAGLQLAAVSLQGRKDTGSFIQAFTGSHRFILDYLMEEVLQRQPESIQTFLLQTSILDSLCAPLCSAVTGIADTQNILEGLEHANLFIIPLDDSRQWYRYHHLFADLLRQRLNQLYPDHVQLHSRASLWLEQNHYIAEAIDQALTAGDFTRTADLIKQHAESYLFNDQVFTLKRWLERFSQEQLLERPQNYLYYIWTLIINGNFSDGEQLLDGLVKRLSSAGEIPEEFQAEIKVTSAIIAMYQGQFESSYTLALQAYRQLPVTKTFVRGVVVWLLSFTTQWNNQNPDLTTQIMQDYQVSNHPRENALLTSLTAYSTGMQQAMHGQLNEALQTFRAGLKSLGRNEADLLAEDPASISPSNSLILHGLGDIFREHNDLENARIYVTKAIETGRIWKNGEFLADMYICMAKIYYALGDITEADAALDSGLALEKENKISGFTIIQIKTWKAWLAALTGRMEIVETWAAANPMEVMGLYGENDFIFTYWQALTGIVLGRLLLSKKQFNEVLAMVADRYDQAITAGWLTFALQMNLLRAYACSRLGNDSQAFLYLEQSLKIAEPEGFMRTFLDEGLPIHQLLLKYDQHAHPQGRFGQYVHRLLAAFENKGPQPSPETAGLVEPLSERERQVLAFMAAGLSNSEIASRIVTAVSTVKSHTNAIYRKMGVSTRTQAIARARDLNII